MQVKKFEAPTIQEALDLVKVELGPEAIILQTKKVRKGFGFNSPVFVEVTAAVSERSLGKKNSVDKRLPDDKKALVQKLPAHQQAGLYEKVIERHRQAGAAHENTTTPKPQKKITATRYAEIDGEKSNHPQDHVSHLLEVSSEGKREEKVEWSSSKGSPVQGSNQRVEMKEPPQVSLQVAHDSYAVLQDEVKALRKIIEEMKSMHTLPSSAQFRDPEGRGHVFQGLETEALENAYDELVVNGVDRRLALNLLKKVSFELGAELSQSTAQVKDALAHEVLESIRVISLFHRSLTDEEGESGSHKGPRVSALIGPTGVGKTSTIAKLASDLQLRQELKLGLIHFDRSKQSSFDQLATYSKLMQVPFRAVSSVQDLRMAMSDFKNLDLILIDTVGKSHRDTEGLHEIHSSFIAIEGIEILLVLSATTRDSELYDAYSRYSLFSPKGLIISKLDEVVNYGGIYNLSQKAKSPLAYFTTGQKIPDDLERATSERLVSLLMDID